MMSLRRTRTAAALGCLLLSLLLLRWQMIFHLEDGRAQVPMLLFATGFLQDSAALALGAGIAWALELLVFLPFRLGLLLLGLLIWIASTVSTLYFSFFGARLEAWIVKSHFADSYQVGGSALVLASNPRIVASFVLLLLFVGLLVFRRIPQARKGAPRTLTFRLMRHGLKLAACTAVLGLALLLKQSPVWFHWMAWDPEEGGFRGNAASDQILFVWWDELYGNPHSVVQDDSLLAGMVSPQQEVEDYSRYPGDGHHPLSPTETRRLRERMGLPQDGPVHVFMVFLESTRGYEYDDPSLAPQVVPRLTNLIRKHGIFFEQAYSSSMEPGQTARGLFSTLCSRLPNIQGPAVYIAYSHVRAACLQDLLSRAGYETMSIQPFKSNYHNAEVFESLHGTQKFFDMNDIVARDPSTKVSGWGAEERSYLRQGLSIVREEARKGKPVFAHFRTNSTHHPFFGNPGFPIAPELKAKIPDGEYVNYLSAMHYSDVTVSEFIQGVFDSELGDRSLVVLLADHSLLRDLGPLGPVSDFQKRELQSRIPLALLSRGMKSPERVRYPVHQVDVAATVARIVGIDPDPSWMGQYGLFHRPGRPWVFRDSSGISYRTEDRVCYSSLRQSGKESCFSLKGGADPLFARALPEIQEDRDQSAFFDRVLRADRYLVHTNQIVSGVEPFAGLRSRKPDKAEN